MTNAEKFKEVFGLEIDDFPADPCDIVDHNVCVNHDCYSCPLHNFWTKDWQLDYELLPKCTYGGR